MRHNGTPKSISEAIKNGLENSGIEDSILNEIVRVHIKDYLAQKFGVAMLNSECSDEEVKRLRELFEKITQCGD